jgi:hypothetical protein
MILVLRKEKADFDTIQNVSWSHICDLKCVWLLSIISLVLYHFIPLIPASDGTSNQRKYRWHGLPTVANGTYNVHCSFLCPNKAADRIRGVVLMPIWLLEYLYMTYITRMQRSAPPLTISKEVNILRSHAPKFLRIFICNHLSLICSIRCRCTIEGFGPSSSYRYSATQALSWNARRSSLPFALVTLPLTRSTSCCRNKTMSAG